jgi:disease resistance protein RPM1
MNAVLRMQTESEDGSVDHFIREWMKQVRELAYDAEDCVHLTSTSSASGAGRETAISRGPGPNACWRRSSLAADWLARSRRSELVLSSIVISERHTRYGVSREALNRSTPASLAAPAPAPGPALGRPAANDPNNLVGITNQANILAKKVMSTNGHDMKLKVVAVVGFGGLGKTTLAVEVCGQLEGEFQRQALVSVSQAFGGSKDLEGLLKRVLHQIVKPKVNNQKGTKEEDPLHGIHTMGVDQLTNKLDEVLKDMRYIYKQTHTKLSMYHFAFNYHFSQFNLSVRVY